MKSALNLKQNQRLTMTPQLQQAVKLLHMNTVELTEELIHAHESNPLLEMEDPTDREEISHNEESDDVETSDESRESKDEDWVSSQTYDRINASATSFDGPFEIPDRASNLTLKQSLEQQLVLMPLPKDQLLICTLIVQYIDDAGYLQLGLEELLKEFTAEPGQSEKTTVEHLGRGLEIIQSLDPIGVGARTPAECLQLQLKATDPQTPAYSAACKIVDAYLPILADRDYQTLKRRLGVDEEKLRLAIDLIRHLNPHPGYSVGDVAVNYVTPDVVVEHVKGAWLARLNTNSLPKVVINQEYQQLVTENAASESFAKMKQQLQDARWLLSNIEKRHSTILSVASQIVERQQAFFEHGPAAMRPMILRDISEALDIHESTVSRATSGKYMLTPLGMFELKYFFSTELGSVGSNQTSAVAIQTFIKEMIANEPPAKPISDMKICQALQDKGYEVARRTVAKYREQMNIPSTSKRKNL